MILQQYEFAVESSEAWSTTAAAEFGFFPPRAMQRPGRHPRRGGLSHEQRGMLASPIVRCSPIGAPFPDSRWRMIDQVDEMLADGGPHGLGVDSRQQPG